MATTLWIDEATRDRLAAIKQQRGLPSLAAVIHALLDAPQETAAMVYARRKKEVDAACKEHGVRRLIAFGSRARGDARPDSDLDLVLELPEAADVIAFLHAKGAVEQAIAYPVDIIDLPRHRPRLMAEIERDGVTLYEA